MTTHTESGGWDLASLGEVLERTGPNDDESDPATAPTDLTGQLRAEAERNLTARLTREEAIKLRARNAARALVAAENRPHQKRVDVAWLGEIMARPPEPAARIDGLLPWAGGLLIVAQRKTGKTTLTLNLARSLLTGEDFLGRFGVQPLPGNVALLNYEVSGAQLARWASEAGIADDRLIIANLRGRRNPLDDADERAQLAQMLRDAEVGALIVDPFGRAYTGQSQNDAGEVAAWLNDLDVFTRSEVGASELILTVHAGWNGERTRGSSALEDWADSIVTLTKDDESRRFLRATGRDVDVDEDELSFDPVTRRLLLSGTGGRLAASTGRKHAQYREAVLGALEANPSGLTGKDLRVLTGFQDAALTAVRRELVASGRVFEVPRRGRGGGSIYMLRPKEAELGGTRRPLPLEGSEGGYIGEPPSLATLTGNEPSPPSLPLGDFCRVCGLPLAEAIRADGFTTHPSCEVPT